MHESEVVNSQRWMVYGLNILNSSYNIYFIHYKTNIIYKKKDGYDADDS